MVQGILLCALSGAIDGCWAVFAAGATMRGLDNYVTCFYFCLGLLLPLIICEWVISCANERMVGATFFSRGYHRK